MIRAEHISFRYGNRDQVLEDISFALEPGHFLAVLGNNGVGKSTLLKCLNRILHAESGSFLMDGEDIFTMSHREIARRIAFVAQSVPDTQMTVYDAVLLGRKPYMTFGFSAEDHRIAQEMLRTMDLEAMKGRFLNELSGGERQKVMLARAMVQQPRLLLLDEPTSSLDIRNQYQVLQIAREFCFTQGKTAIVVIHDINLALRFCDRFLLMKEGKIYRYGDSTCLDRTALREIYGVQGTVEEIRGRKMVLIESEADIGT